MFRVKLSLYFSKVIIPKEWSTIPEYDSKRNVSTMLEGADLRKRKGDHLMVEDLDQQTKPGKTRRLMVEEDDETCGIAISRTNSPVLWGAKSGFGRETTSGQNGMGLDLKTLTIKEGGTSLGLDGLKTRKCINSQRI